MWQSIETLNDLIEVLTEYAEIEKDGKAIGELPVRIAHQKNWPLAELIEAVTVCEHDGETAVWLAASPAYNLDYAPRNAWEGGIEGEDFEDDEEDW